MIPFRAFFIVVALALSWSGVAWAQTLASGWGPAPGAASILISVSSASAATALPTTTGPLAPNVLIRNTGSQAVYLAFGGSGVVAYSSTAGANLAGSYLPANVSAVYTPPAGTGYLAAVTASSTSTLVVEVGVGAPLSSLPGGAGAPLSPALGGTGVNNGTFTITLGGNQTTGGAFTQSGAFATTLTSTATSNSTLPAGTHNLAPLDNPSFTVGQTTTPTAAASVALDQAQAAGGSASLAFASTSGIAVNQTVSGTNIPAGDQVSSIVATAQVTLTASGVSNSGQKVLTTTATAGSAVGQQCTDLTTPSAIGAGNLIASIQAGVSITMTANLTANTANNDSVVCDPVVTLASATSAAATGTMTFYTNATALSASSAIVDNGDASVYGALIAGGRAFVNSSNITGSAAAPNLAIGHANNGFFVVASNQIDVSVYGAQTMQFNPTSVVLGPAATGGLAVENGAATPWGQVINNSATLGNNGLAVLSYRASTTIPATLYLAQSHSSTIATQAAVASGTQLSRIVTEGSDGTNFQNAAIIQGEVDNTVSAGVVPGRLKFLTANASGAMTQAALFDSSQNTTLAGTVSASNIQPTGSTAPTVGMALPAAGQLGLYGTTAELFSGASDIWDYGVTTASVLTLNNATTINSATFKVTTLAASTAVDTVCYSTVTGLFTEEPTGTTCTVSDERKKTAMLPIDNRRSLDIILASSPISYYYKPEAHLDDDYHLGFGAQTLARIAPELVQRDAEGVPEAVKQIELLPITWAAIKQIGADNDERDAEIARLRRRVGALERTLRN